MEPIYQIKTGPNGQILAVMSSNVLSEGYVSISQILFNQALEAISSGSGGFYRNGKVVPNPIIPLVIPKITYKADVWRRVTDVQANQLDTEIQKLGVRERNLWSDSTYLDHSDPFVTMLKEAMVEQWGQAETDRILAPSEG